MGEMEERGDRGERGGPLTHLGAIERMNHQPKPLPALPFASSYVKCPPKIGQTGGKALQENAHTDP